MNQTETVTEFQNIASEFISFYKLCSIKWMSFQSPKNRFNGWINDHFLVVDKQAIS